MRELELERANAVLATVFETLPVGVLVEEAERTVLAANQQLIDLFGVGGSPSEVIGEDCEELTEALSERVVDADEFLARTDELVTDREPVQDEQWTLTDGRTVARTHRIVDLPGGDGHLWAYRDVTQSRETLRELSESEERLSLALAAGGMGTWELDLKSEQSAVRSPRHDEIFGYDEPQEEWGFETFMEHVHPDDREAVTRSFDTAFETGSWEFECRITRTDGETRWIHAEGEFHDDADGDPERAIGVVEDVTDRKRYQAELEEMNERLDQFTSMVTHDIRNPLAIAQGRLDLYRETGEDSDLRAVERAIDRIQEIVTDLTTIARHGESAGDHEPVSLGEIARSAWEMVDTRSATLVTDDATVTGDAGQLQGLFENLFRNAIGHGGSDVTVRVGPLSDGFYVEDTGAGIAPEKRSQVFEHGYTTGYGGTGIGLTIVRRIADSHSLDLSVAESAEGGARFEFRRMSANPPNST